MRKYHSHTLLYLHETIALGTGSSAGFTPETERPDMPWRSWVFR
jgi:hypothetical protein